MSAQKKSRQEIYIYLDDSGVLHRNSEGRYFVYAGFIFLSKKEKNEALVNYRGALRDLGRRKIDKKELKASGAKAKQKRFLIYRMSRYESLSCVVDKRKVYGAILDDKKSIHRYKDYCIKRMVRFKIENLITQGKIDPDKETDLHIFIDEQPNSTNGFYSLRDSIYEEFCNGIMNFNYHTFHEPVFRSATKVNLTFCDSSRFLLIQASDMLANSIFVTRNHKKDLKIKLDNAKHHTLQLP